MAAGRGASMLGIIELQSAGGEGKLNTWEIVMINKETVEKDACAYAILKIKRGGLSMQVASFIDK